VLTKYEERHGDEEAIAISTKWRFSAQEAARLASTLGSGVVTSEVVTVDRRYGKGISVGVSIDFACALEGLYSRFSLDESERAVLSSAANTSDLISILDKLSSRTERHEQIKAHLAKVGTVTAQVKTLVLSMLPKFMYFAAYDRMAGAIQLEQTRQLIATGQIDQEAHRGERLFAEFLDFAGVSIDDITTVTTYETFNARLQAASNNITDQVLEYWTPEPGPQRSGPS
jgi:hypothetical protein